MVFYLILWGLALASMLTAVGLGFALSITKEKLRKATTPLLPPTYGWDYTRETGWVDDDGLEE